MWRFWVSLADQVDYLCYLLRELDRFICLFPSLRLPSEMFRPVLKNHARRLRGHSLCCTFADDDDGAIGENSVLRSTFGEGTIEIAGSMKGLVCRPAVEAFESLR